MTDKVRPISELSNNGVKVLLLRRTGNNHVKACVGYRYASGEIEGWHGRPPTHWIPLPPFASKAKGTKPKKEIA